MILKRNAILLVSIFVLIVGCVDPPEFDNSPKITYEGLYLGKSPNGEDSLVVSVSFKDGDGDLGFGITSNVIEPPYHQFNFFVNNGGSMLAVPSTLVQNFRGYRYKSSGKTPGRPSFYVPTPGGQVGELITLASRNDGFSLPPFTSPYLCLINEEAYIHEQQQADTVFVSGSDGYLIKDHATIVDTLVRNDDPAQYFLAVVDYFYIRENPFHYNFKVDFLIKNNDGSFTEFDFRKEFCETYDGRFPLISDDDRALEGIINYSMVSSGFFPTFSIKTMKLAITIYDKALNQSNTVETPEFRLGDL
jgi:hypothetical protein